MVNVNYSFEFLVLEPLKLLMTCENSSSVYLICVDVKFCFVSFLSGSQNFQN